MDANAPRARGAVAALVLGACAFGIVEVLPEPEEMPVAEPVEASRSVVYADVEAPAPANPCEKPNKVVTIAVDGAPEEMEIFVECDPKPYRDLGDPQPKAAKVP